ncbi:Uncharacterized protein Rs2_04209 [Raphanus sativus]|uniref:Protein NUCLEAR FUSION DEFECTIVE 6, mitochondrial n=1 Tax=Raphanus sativus TaxID=3726 RepID=A0A9W3CJ64_RAPSA|nr:protein NUCLEAR FUSION DEFECTIVE 6, mitochondrial [Raphanus sativus]KAJ4909588.1 Uncharacterized protein Rs2_04209 [Raphanus sativus]
MAANGVRRALNKLSSSSSTTGRTLFARSSSGPSVGKSAGFAFSNGSSSSRSSLRRLTSSRVPVELSAGMSLIPLHSVTASALLTSLLSLSNQSWGCLSEGFGTTL